MKRIIVLFLLLGLCGCAFVFRDINEREYKNLKFGMSKEEVIRALGASSSQATVTIEGLGYEVWVYPDNESKIRKINSLGVSNFKVYFLNGKLDRWGREKIYAQPSYEPLETNPLR